MNKKERKEKAVEVFNALNELVSDTNSFNESQEYGDWLEEYGMDMLGYLESVFKIK